MISLVDWTLQSGTCRSLFDRNVLLQSPGLEVPRLFIEPYFFVNT